MHEPIPERETVWSEFLAKWPLSRLRSMSLQEYTKAGDKDSLTYWLESRTEGLGSIWGGSAFKFGIYNRKDKQPRASGEGVIYGDEYAWLEKYGETAPSAFDKVRALVVAVAEAAARGDLDAIEPIDLGPVTKWKIAFLYQDRSAPSILNIFKVEHLRTLAAAGKDASAAQLHRKLTAERGDKHILALGDELWSRIEAIEAAQMKTQEALEFLQRSAALTVLKPPTKKMAGFATSSGRQLALALDNKTPTLYLAQGDWLERVRSFLSSAEPYSATRTRSSSIEANAPKLWTPNPIVKVTVETLSALTQLIDAYAGAAETGSPNERLSEESENNPMLKDPSLLNQIFYGAPGTGKTYETVSEAIRILDAGFWETHQANRVGLKRRFDALLAEGRIGFVTFHQSFSYEDFVEGLRAEIDESGAGLPKYVVEPGIFRQICERAQQQSSRGEEVGVGDAPRIWKISIDGTGPSPTRDWCLSHGEARIGWDYVGDLRTASLNTVTPALGSNDKDTLLTFANGIAKGDILVCIASATEIGAVGVVTGEYRFDPTPPPGTRHDYKNVLPVRWLAGGLHFDVLTLNANTRFTQKTVYELERFTWPELVAAMEADGIKLEGLSSEASAGDEVKPHVLIIDEINRGNVSRVFGELITLIEPSKRVGAAEELRLTLPYSKKRFGVPANLHIIGTMNTADRSLTGLDIALRRRFVFRELPPRPELLDGVEVNGIRIGNLLRALNSRIEALLDRDHCLGHAYFLPLKTERTVDRLRALFQDNILPLLQEYFFDDAERIGWVLNDPNAPVGVERFMVSGASASQSLSALFGEETAARLQDNRWRINDKALASIDSYRNILGLAG